MQILVVFSRIRHTQTTLTVVRSNQRALMSTRFSDLTICSSSAEETVTYTIYPRRSKSMAIALVIGSCGDPATTMIISTQTPVQIKCGHYDTYQQSLSLRRCLPFWPFSVFRAISCFHSIIQHRFRERRAWPPTMRDSEPSSFGSGLSGLAMTAFSGKHELGEQWVVAMTAGPAYP